MNANGSGLAGFQPVFAQTMVRVKDPVKTEDFYVNKLGMRRLASLDFPDSKESTYLFAYSDEEGPDPASSNPEKSAWLSSRPYPMVECRHRWRTESDEGFAYHNGNSDPRGFGHMGLTINDIHEACANLEEAGVKIVRKPGPFKDVGSIAFCADPDNYWIELIERDEKAAGPSAGLIGPDPVYAQTMIRVKDPQKSVAFYEQLGMKMINKFDFPDLTFSLFFLAYTEDEIDGSTSQADRARWLWSRRYPTLELTYNYGTEKDPNFQHHNGNTEPLGFGYVGVVVDNVRQVTESLKGVGTPIIREPASSTDAAPLAFVADPDGYWVGLTSRTGAAPAQAYMKP
uniref:lactoylglutathione lyase n=1 Tax=Compsopogon caeruleus TaxID=31354 RepID=A0A7S1XFI5_9RHOD